MYRIGKVQFATRDEAEAWVQQGNIGGTYSIEPLTFCYTCGDWQADGPRCEVCGAALGDDGEFHGGDKRLAKVGIPHWRMNPTHPLWELHCWTFGLPIH